MKALLAGLMLIVAFASVGWVTIVTNIQGRSVAETAPTNGQALVYDTSTGTWKPGDVAASLTAHQSTHQPGQDDSLADTFVVTTRSVTAAGSYVTGGGDLSANRTFDLAIGAVSADVTPTWANVQSKPSTFAPSAHQSSHQAGASDSLSDTFTLTTRSITAAGTYLTGGGDFSADRTFGLALGAVSADVTPTWANVQSKPSSFTPSAHQSTHQPGQSDSLSDTYALTTTQIVAGTGLSGGGAISGNVVLNVDSSVLTPSYSNLQGTPSTFAPSAHAASHTNGTDNLTVSGFLTIDATAGISPRYSTSDFDVSAGNLVLHNVVSAGTVGDASNYPVITYDAKGRITGVSTISVTSTSSSTVAYVEQHELIPLYIYPGSDWDTVASQAPGTGMVIVNPNSGPGSSLDTTYQSYIKALQRKGVYCVGYVATTYGARAIDDVKAEIALYYKWYQPDGIFLDEIPTTTGASELTYYANLYAYTKTHSGRALVVLNPGTNTAEEYMARSDVICTWENPYSTYAAYTPDSWTTKYPANRFYHIAVEASSAEALTFKALAKTRNVGWVYATDDVMPNPFDALPTYGVTQTGYLRTCAVAPLLENTGTPTGTYGSSTKSAVLTVDDKGRVTNVTETAMPVDQAQATGSLRTISTASPSALGTAAAAGNGTAASAYNHVHAGPAVTAGTVSAKPCTALVVNAGTGTTVTGSESSGTVNVTVGGVIIPTSGGYVTRGSGHDYLTYSADKSAIVCLYEDSAWTPHSIPSAGVTLTCTGLPTETTYYHYLKDVGGTLTPELSETTYTTQDGVPVKNGDTASLLIGVCVTDEVAGEILTPTQCTTRSCYVNLYNQRQVNLPCDQDTTHSYTDAAWRVWNGDTTQYLQVMSWAGYGRSVLYTQLIWLSAVSTTTYLGVGVNSTTSPYPQFTFSVPQTFQSVNIKRPTKSTKYYLLEYGAAGTTFNYSGMRCTAWQ